MRFRLRLYLISMLLILGTGIAFAIMATTPQSMAAGLLSISVGGGGLSSGILTRLASRS